MPAPHHTRIKADQLGVRISHIKHEAEDFYSFDFDGQHVVETSLTDLNVILDNLLAEQQAFRAFADDEYEFRRAEAIEEFQDLGA